MIRKLKQLWTSEGITSAKYQRRADRITNVMGWIGIGMAAVGIIVIWWLAKHPWTNVEKSIEGLSILHK